MNKVNDLEKVILKLEKRDFITKTFAEQEIKIIPYIELEEIDKIVYGVLDTLIEEKDIFEIINAEDKVVLITRMNTYVIGKCTNIDLNCMDYDILTTSGLEDYIFKFIANYDILLQCLLDAMREHNFNVTVLNIFKGIPEEGKMMSDATDLVNQLKDISEDKLKMVVNQKMHEEAVDITKNKE